MDDLPFGYCTNVHAGVDLPSAQHNLRTIATQVRMRLAPKGRLPVGLWLSQTAAEQLIQADNTSRFGQWLEDQCLLPYTFNGFPQGDFHQPVVKHAVYEPDWRSESRLEYTLHLSDILSQLRQGNGSISTLPLGWPHHAWSQDDFRRAGQNLQRVAEHLDRLAQQRGCHIVLAIEPEPGCVFDTAPGLSQFLTRFVFDDRRPFIRRHIGVCHDICHSAVMFEAQEAALSHYRSLGVRVGKVQVSSAIEVPWDRGLDAEDRRQMREQLVRLDERRYLHQTTRPIVNGNVDDSSTTVDMAEDLPVALANWLPRNDLLGDVPTRPWRIHFHVPIFVETFGSLLATRADIVRVVNYLKAHADYTVEGHPWFTGDYEVETYAWGVLPVELRSNDLALGISRELEYLREILGRGG